MDTVEACHIAGDSKPIDTKSLAQEVGQQLECSEASHPATTAYQDTKELEDGRQAMEAFQKPFQFLLLPREVRDQIYRHSLVAADWIRPHQLVQVIQGLSFEIRRPSPSLCLTNKQVHRESIEILYGENRFSFTYPRDLHWFEEQIGASNHALVRRLEIFGMFTPDLDDYDR
jgi:hypothetical protein